MNAKGTFLKRILAVPPSRCHRYFALGGGGYGLTNAQFCGETLVAERNGSSLLAMSMVESTAAGKASYRVTVVDADGVPRFSRSYPYIPRPVSRESLDSATAARKKAFAKLPPELVSAMPNMPPATSWPPLLRIIIGRDATVWLEQSSADLTRHSWLALDQKGNVAGTVTLPANVSLEVADLNAAWGLETDSDGLQGVVRYRVGR